MNNRIAKLLKVKDVTASKFAEMIEVQPSNISHILSGRNKPSLEFVIKVVNAFPDINLEWLIFGKGKMFVTPVSFELSENSQNRIENNPQIPIKSNENQLIGTLFDDISPDENEINSIIDDEVINESKITELKIESDKNEAKEPEAETQIAEQDLKQVQHEIAQIEKTISKENENIPDTTKKETVLQKLIFIYSDKTFEEINPRNK